MNLAPIRRSLAAAAAVVALCSPVLVAATTASASTRRVLPRLVLRVSIRANPADLTDTVRFTSPKSPPGTRVLLTILGETGNHWRIMSTNDVALYVVWHIGAGQGLAVRARAIAPGRIASRPITRILAAASAASQGLGTGSGGGQGSSGSGVGKTSPPTPGLG